MISARTLVLALSTAAVALTAMPAASFAKPNTHLVVVNENSGKVVYDDGRDDYFCTSRRVPVGYDRVFAGYASDGAPLFKTVVRYAERVKHCN